MAGPANGPVVAEACESDGTLVGYEPTIGLVHNISRDHAEVESLRAQFGAFARNCSRLFVNAGCPEAAALGRRLHGVSYGVTSDADARLEVVERGARPRQRHPEAARRRGHARHPAARPAQPRERGGRRDDRGRARHRSRRGHRAAGALPRRVPPLRGGGRDGLGIRVVDDYAHNGEKLRAALTTAQAGLGRVVAVFQPHGFGPARFLRPELKMLLPGLLRIEDRFCYAEIFYAGGTVAKDISSRALADDLPGLLRCGYAADHEAARRWAVAEAKPGDTVLVMGARDPDLPRLARSIFDSLARA
jgi:UDP-N-acetylmuramate--alanine ligase